MPDMSETAASPRVRAIQRTALALVVLGGVVNYIDRATLAVGNPLIRHELGLSAADMGLLLSAFLWAYAFSQLPAGALVDRLGPRRLLAAGMTLWSVAQLLGGLVRSFGEFFAARMLLGAGESPQFPASARIARDWFNVRDRGLATGLWNCSSTLGTAISAPLLTGLMLAFGWRWMFAIMGLAGLGVAILFYAVYREPHQVALTAEEQRYRTEGDESDARADPVTWAEWKRLFAFRTTWGMLLGFFGTIYVTWIYTAWLPAYLEQERHISIARTGWVAAVPYVFGVVGSIFGGRVVDWLVARGMAPMHSRKYPMAASLLLTALATAIAAETASNVVAVAAISVSLFLLYVSSTSAWAMPSVAAPANCTASLGAMQNFGGYLGGALAPTVTGFIVQATGFFAPALLVGAAVAVVCALGYLALVGGAIPAAGRAPALAPA
jgi:sugar phosphate permease